MAEGRDRQFGLTEETIERVRAVFATHPRVQRAVLYGSRAKGTSAPGSDIDLVLFGRDLTVEDLLKIDGELDDLLLPYKIDLSLYAQIRCEALLEHIQRVGKEFYQIAADRTEEHG